MDNDIFVHMVKDVKNWDKVEQKKNWDNDISSIYII